MTAEAWFITLVGLLFAMLALLLVLYYNEKPINGAE